MKYESVSLEQFIADAPVEAIPAQTEEREWSAKPLGLEHDGEMLPCPFCGSKNSGIVGSDARITDAVGSLARGGSGPREGERAEAVEAWNRRVR